MSGLLNNLHDLHQQHKERREERREARHERQGLHDDDDSYDSRGSQRHHRRYDDDASHHQSYPQDQGGRGYASPPGRPPAAFAVQGGLERDDFASDADVDRMLVSGKFNERQGRQYEYSGASDERGSAYGRYDAPSGPPPGQGYEGRGSDHGWYDPPSGPPPGQGHRGRYDTPAGPPPGRGDQAQPRQDYVPGGVGYGGGSDRQNQYGPQRPQGFAQYDSARSQGNVPSGGFSASRDEDNYHSGYGGPHGDRDEPPHRGEAASYYQQGPSGDGYARQAGTTREHGDDDPEMHRRTTQSLHDRVQTQTQSRRAGEEDDYRTHVDAHRKAYGDDDHGPMDADAIGSAAAIEAIKQTAAASNAPAGAFKTGGGKAGRAGQEVEEDEEDVAATRAAGSGGMQDKLMSLAMSQAGKLFDKKNGDSGKAEDKTQAMQSAAATAMQLFTKYQSKGKLDSSDIMGLAKNFF